MNKISNNDSFSNETETSNFAKPRLAAVATPSQIKALKILQHTSYGGILYTARGFAEEFWKDSDTNMFSSSKNQGNGACRGKAAWLCGGSYLGKLRKKGYVLSRIKPNGFYISPKGLELLRNSS